VGLGLVSCGPGGLDYYEFGAQGKAADAFVSVLCHFLFMFGSLVILCGYINIVEKKMTQMYKFTYFQNHFVF